MQSAWSLLLHCASAKANYLLRVVEPNAVAEFAHLHDQRIWNCLCQLLHVDPSQNEEVILSASGLHNAARTSVSAYWASWADTLPMIRARHGAVADLFVRELEREPESPFLAAAAEAMRSLTGTMGFTPPSWQALSTGVRPATREPDEFELGGIRQGWQHEAASRVEQQFRDQVLFERLPASARALMRSQAGPGAGTALPVVPTSYLTQIPPHLFRVILLRRLRLPLPPSLLRCRCGRPIDSFGHHRAACARSGVLGRRGFVLESAREAGRRVGTNCLMRDTDLPVLATDSRRLEVVVDGLPLFGGCQLAVDTTLVCAMHCDGTPHDGAPNRDGVVLEAARRSRARLVALAVEVGGRWSPKPECRE